MFEVTEPGFPHDEAVRIFVQFERVDSAIKVGVWGWVGWGVERRERAWCCKLVAGMPCARGTHTLTHKHRLSPPPHQASLDLSGRYFGGRLVKATFFDEERFAAQELAPRPGEVQRNPAVEAAAAAAAAIAARLAAQAPR